MYYPVIAPTRHKHLGIKYGFTLIELLVVVAIITLLVVIVTAMTTNIMKSAKSTKEAASLRQLLQAYTMAATERDGKLIPGYSNGVDEHIVGLDGEKIHWPVSGRYVWRIFPYLDNALQVLYSHRQQDVLSQIAESECFSYIVSLYPAFGLNSEWLGGDYRTTASPALESRHLYASYLSDVKQPANQLVFASTTAPQGSEDSSDVSGCIGSNPSELGRGYFEISSPYDFTWRWHTVNGEHSFTPTQDSADFGNIDPRHARQVLTGQLDGSTTFIQLQELADMRRWTPIATHAEWNLSDIIP